MPRGLAPRLFTLKNMLYKNIILLSFIFCLTSLFSQTRNGEWQVGVSAGVTKFSDENALVIGDKHQFQIPRINVTKPLHNNLAIDVAMTFTTFDVGFIGNEETYFAADASLRYFYEVGQTFYPYAFAGIGAVDTAFRIAPTLNVGVGGTIWFNAIFGINGQVFYKNSLSADNTPSHIQVTAGMVFALDPYDLLYGIINGCARKY